MTTIGCLPHARHGGSTTVKRPYMNLKTYLEYKKRGIDTLKAHERKSRSWLRKNLPMRRTNHESPTLVPPLKCQGMKTKLVPSIQKIAKSRPFSRWVEPFCGSALWR